MGLSSITPKVQTMKNEAWKAYAKWVETHSRASVSPPSPLVTQYANEMYAKIDQAFLYWTATLPEPDQYDEALDALSSVDHLITGPSVRGTLVTLNDLSQDWKGDGNTNFQENFLDQLPGITDRHSKMVLALHNAYKLAKEIVETSEKDAGKLADEAIAVFKKQAADDNGVSASDAKILLDMVALAAGIGSAAATGGATLVLAGIAGVASFTSNRIEGKDEPVTLKGDYALEVADSIATEAHRIKSETEEAATGLSRLIGLDIQKISEFNDHYVPMRPKIAGPA